jgi:hypothetical protein
VKPHSEKIIETLQEIIQLKPPHCLRTRIGACFGMLFQTVGTTHLGQTVNSLCDIVRTKDDQAQVRTRL